MIFFFSKVMHSDVCVTRRRLFLSSFFASSFSSLKKKGQIRARRDEGDLVICGHGFSSFPFPLFYDKSELVPIFSFSLVILCLIKTYIPSWFLGRIGQYRYLRDSLSTKRMSICKLCISLNSL